MIRLTKQRRRFLIASGALLCIPGSLQAQQSAKSHRIGYLASAGDFDVQVSLAGLKQRLRELGYVEARNLQIEYRSAEGNLARLAELAEELVRLKVDLIVAGATPAARAAQRATTKIPIVALSMGDPVGDGLVASLAHPGGNLTGTTFLGPKLVPKHLELLKETLPGISHVTILRHLGAFSSSTMGEMVRETEAAAGILQIRLRFADVQAAEELEPAFSRIPRGQADALVVFPSPVLFSERKRIVALAEKYRLPVMFNNRQAVELGGLIGYGTSIADLARQGATYVDRILKGAKPSELPVQQPTKFELVVNARTAKKLGITIPNSILVRADRVIE